MSDDNRDAQHHSRLLILDVLFASIVGIALQTRKRSVECLIRLYEQGTPVERIGDSVRRWQRWAVSGLGAYSNSISGLVLNACGVIA